MRSVTLLSILVLGLTGCWIQPKQAIPPVYESPTFGDDFWATWGDGKAEIASYDLIHPHYGEPRQGTAVTIFVTETFDPAQRVKSDSNEGVSVMKLNLVEDFPTGVYDYNLMTSAFVTLEPTQDRPAGQPYKVSFSAQEWCGHVWQQWLFDAAEVHVTEHSYFQGEADRTQTIAQHPKGVIEDAGWHWARGFAGPALQPGARVDVRLLPAIQRLRQSHGQAEWEAGTLSRGAAETIEVPAGTFEVEAMTLSTPGFQRTFYVETAEPRRIIRWETSDGEQADLIASERMEYWRMNGPEGQQMLEELGLQPRPPRTM